MMNIYIIYLNCIYIVYLDILCTAEITHDHSLQVYFKPKKKTKPPNKPRVGKFISKIEPYLVHMELIVISLRKQFRPINLAFNLKNHGITKDMGNKHMFTLIIGK